MTTARVERATRARVPSSVLQRVPRARRGFFAWSRSLSSEWRELPEAAVPQVVVPQADRAVSVVVHPRINGSRRLTEARPQPRTVIRVDVAIVVQITAQ